MKSVKVVSFPGFRHVSEKPGYQLEKCSYIQKGPCGVGITSWCCSNLNSENTIIVAPSVSLYESLIQDSGRLVGKLTIDSSTLIPFNSQDSEEFTVEELLRKASEVTKQGKHWKIITTGDSLYKLADNLLLSADRVVIDESDDFLANTSIIDTERKDRNRLGLQLLSEHPEKVTFLSSTPIRRTSLPKWIQDLTQIDYHWNNTIQVEPKFIVGNPMTQLWNSIVKPLSENRWIAFNSGKPVTKVIIYLNNFRDLIKFIDKHSLNQDEVRVVAGKGDSNDKVLRRYKLKRLEDYSKLPKFTFVTRAGWRGISLYDTEALTVVVSKFITGYTGSNTNGSYNLSSIVNLYSDLEQVIGRNRCQSNPHITHPVVLVCKAMNGKEVLSNFTQLIEKNRAWTENELGYEGRTEESWQMLREKAFYLGTFTFKDTDGKYKFDESSYTLLVDNLRDKLGSISYEVFGEDSGEKLSDLLVTTKDVRYRYIIECVKLGKPLGQLEKDSPEFQDVITWKQEYPDREFPESLSDLRVKLGSKVKRSCAKSQEAIFKDKVRVEAQKVFKLGEWYTAKELTEKLQRIYDKLAGKERRVVKQRDLGYLFNLESKSMGGLYKRRILDFKEPEVRLGLDKVKPEV